MSLKDKRNNARSSLDEQKKSILNKWKDQWCKEQGDENLHLFYELFQAVYSYTLYSMTDNKKKNGRYKKAFLLILIIGVLGILGYITLFVYSFFYKKNALPALRENSLLMVSLILLIFLSSIISKWLDIKKYQETWARHSWHLHMLETEMLRFISNIEPYNNSNNKMIFAEKILKIWDMNQEKFVHNMEDKERTLTDVFSVLKK